MSGWLILLRGVPGCGKSTLADQMVTLGFADVSYEADEYFTIGGEYKFDPTKLHQAHQWCQDMTRSALRKGRYVVVSNTSTTEKEVEVYRQMAQECGSEFISLVVENRHGGENTHGVPAEKLQQMRQRFSVKL